MSDKVEILFPVANCSTAFPERLKALRAICRQPAQLDLQQRLKLLNQLSDILLAKRSELPSSLSNAGLAFLLAFIRSSNLEEIIKRQVPDPFALDKFVPIGDKKSLRILPKGLVSHWIAGNVPLLGMFSWAISAVLGNTNVIRLSSNQDDLISPLLEELSASSTEGRLLAEETLLVRFYKDHRIAHEHMSREADMRIAWGGLEAMEAIKALPCQWECEDIALGPRVSLAVIDPNQADESCITRLATDAVFFDQQACSSPQTIFVKGRYGESQFDTFVDQFTRAFENQSNVYQRHSLDFSETYQIQLDRARILLEGGELRSDSETQWTIALISEPVAKVHCANRFIQIAPFENFAFIFDRIPYNVQTVITCLTQSDTEIFSEKASRLGVCRFPRPGEGNHFEVPWDGIPLVPRLTRWILRSNPE